MKVHLFNKTARWCAVSVVALVMASCELSMSDNGRLDGYWHLVAVDTLSTGGSHDVSQDKYFWAWQYRLVVVADRAYQTPNRRLLFHFEHRADTLRLYDAHIDDRPNGDPPVEDVALLQVYGIDSPDERFIIEALSGSKMILRSSTLRLYFRKM